MVPGFCAFWAPDIVMCCWAAGMAGRPAETCGIVPHGRALAAAGGSRSLCLTWREVVDAAVTGGEDMGVAMVIVVLYVSAYQGRRRCQTGSRELITCVETGRRAFTFRLDMAHRSRP